MTQLKLYPAEVIRTLDRRYVQEYDTSGLKLMGKAARSVLAFIESEMPNAERAQVFCGSAQGDFPKSRAACNSGVGCL